MWQLHRERERDYEKKLAKKNGLGRVDNDNLMLCIWYVHQFRGRKWRKINGCIISSYRPSRTEINLKKNKKKLFDAKLSLEICGSALWSHRDVLTSSKVNVLEYKGNERICDTKEIHFVVVFAVFFWFNVWIQCVRTQFPVINLHHWKHKRWSIFVKSHIAYTDSPACLLLVMPTFHVRQN